MFFNRKARKFVQDNGGMVCLYQEIVDHFVELGFTIYEVKKDYMYLHFGNMMGKAGIEIHQLNDHAARLTYAPETPHGLYTKHEFEINSKVDYRDLILKMESDLNEFGAITSLHEKKGQIDNESYYEISNDGTNNSPSSVNSFYKEMDDVIDKAIFHEEVNNMKKAFQLNYDVPITEPAALAYSQSDDFPVATYIYVVLFLKDTAEMKYLYGAIFNSVKMGNIDDAKSLISLAELGFEMNYRIKLANAIIEIIEGSIPLADNYIDDAKSLAEFEDSDDYDFMRVQQIYNDAILKRYRLRQKKNSV